MDRAHSEHALLAALLAGCGSSHTSTAKPATTTTANTTTATTAEAPLTANLLKADHDKDSDGGGADLQERHGLAVLNFGELPEREIHVAREGHTWRVTALIDTELP